MSYEKGEAVVLDFLAHAGQYDPVKAHEYYLRNRKLKGRTGAGTKPTADGGGATVTPIRRPAKKASSSRQEAEARVAAIRARLDRLKEELRKLVEAAQKRSGVDTKDPKAKKAPASKKPDKPRTLAEKKADAKRAKEARDKEPSTPSQEVAALNKQIEETKQKIEEAKKRLREIMARARDQQPKPQTAGTKPSR